MRKSVILLVLCLSMSAWAASAHAATADAQGNCSGFLPTFCVFDATRTSSSGSGTSCGSASIVQYFWDFGDGSSTFTTSSFVSHSYSTRDAFILQLAVFCSDGTSATTQLCVNTSLVGAFGCIHPGQGWQP